MADGQGGVPDGMAGKYPVKTGGPADIQTAWKIMAGGAPVAAATLIDIAENGKSELARVQASQAVLDRVGLATPKERPSVTFHVIPKEFGEVGIGAQQLSPAEVVRGRLTKLKKQMAGLPVGGEAQPGAVDTEEAGADGWADWDENDSPGGVYGGGVSEGPVDAEIVDDDEDGDGDPWS